MSKWLFKALTLNALSPVDMAPDKAKTPQYNFKSKLGNSHSMMDTILHVLEVLHVCDSANGMNENLDYYLICYVIAACSGGSVISQTSLSVYGLYFNGKSNELYCF